MGCMEGHAFGCQCYPPCPEPHRTLGQAEHCDPDFLTILLQDQIGALQVLHEGHQIDIPPPADGGLIVNIGDLLQGCTLISYCYYAAKVNSNNNTKTPKTPIWCKKLQLFTLQQYTNSHFPITPKWWNE
ncbi:hypothetical protein PTKIN_Ptkin01aG0354500 [Pterospermum kingtungense]